METEISSGIRLDFLYPIFSGDVNGGDMRKTILLVEDDVVVINIIKVSLEGKYNILIASNCSRALKQLKNHIDLAIINYKLPDCNGLDLLKEIREVKPALPAIMITAYSTEDMIINALRAGATDYIKKPFSPAYLLMKISEILGEKEDIGHFKNVDSRGEFITDGIAAYVKERYGDDLTLDKLAKMAGMNKYKFSKIFRERIGQSFPSYLNSIRVKSAAELLRNSGLSITEIAHFVGYKSIVHFERVFRSQYGLSPRELRSDVNSGYQFTHAAILV
ncbi:MAG: response regulator [Nitrospirota bacterium]